MANSPTEPQFFESFDGTRLAWRELGEGRPVVLIHGFFSNATINWIKYGHAAKIAAAGFRVIMPDLRAHGDSAKPHDAASYPPDVLMRDGFALIEHLGLSNYDLAGYSLGGRTTMRMLANGATPRRAVLSGMGLEGILHTSGRGHYFHNVLTNLGSFARGSSEWLTEAFLKTTGGDPVALLRILDTFVEWLGRGARRSDAACDLPVGAGQPYERGAQARARRGNRRVSRGLTGRGMRHRLPHHVKRGFP